MVLRRARVLAFDLPLYPLHDASDKQDCAVLRWRVQTRWGGRGEGSFSLSLSLSLSLFRTQPLFLSFASLLSLSLSLSLSRSRCRSLSLPPSKGLLTGDSGCLHRPELNPPPYNLNAQS